MPDADLPVLLPDDVDFQPGGESPLARHPTWKHVACPSCGGEASATPTRWTRSSTRAGTSSGTARPTTRTGPFRPEDVARWMPVGQYTGGVEHAILHLLYTRFFTKVLHDIGMVGFVEPFPQADEPGAGDLRRGLDVEDKGQHRGADAARRALGADTMRLIMLFAGPFEDDIDWKLIAGDPDRRPGDALVAGPGVRRRRRRGGDVEPSEPEALARLTHRTIKGVTEDLERFRFNTAISKLMVLTNEMRAALDGGGGARAAARALVRCSPRSRPSPPRSCGGRCWVRRSSRAHVRRGRPSTPPSPPRRRSRWWSRSTARCATRSRSPPTSPRTKRSQRRARQPGARRAIDGREVVKEIVRAPKLVNFVTRR